MFFFDEFTLFSRSTTCRQMFTYGYMQYLFSFVELNPNEFRTAIHQQYKLLLQCRSFTFDFVLFLLLSISVSNQIFRCISLNIAVVGNVFSKILSCSIIIIRLARLNVRQVSLFVSLESPVGFLPSMECEAWKKNRHRQFSWSNFKPQNGCWIIIIMNWNSMRNVFFFFVLFIMFGRWYEESQCCNWSGAWIQNMPMRAQCLCISLSLCCVSLFKTSIGLATVKVICYVFNDNEKYNNTIIIQLYMNICIRMTSRQIVLLLRAQIFHDFPFIDLLRFWSIN